MITPFTTTMLRGPSPSGTGFTGASWAPACGHWPRPRPWGGPSGHCCQPWGTGPCGPSRLAEVGPRGRCWCLGMVPLPVKHGAFPCVHQEQPGRQPIAGRSPPSPQVPGRPAENAQVAFLPAISSSWTSGSSPWHFLLARQGWPVPPSQGVQLAPPSPQL